MDSSAYIWTNNDLHKNVDSNGFGANPHESILRVDAVMALLSDEVIAQRARRGESSRLSNVSSRLTHAETERLDSLAERRGLQRGEFIRQLILNALAHDDSAGGAGPVLTEIVGVQLLLMNVLKPVATGQPLTASAFDKIVSEVHKLKQTVARKLVQEGE
jgi:hypothetical protein